MTNLIIDAINNIELIYEKVGHDYTYKNTNNDDIPIYDYSNDIIPIERVKRDRNEILDILSEAYDKCTDNNIDDFAILYAIYCNIYIKWGIHSRLNKGAKDNFSLEKYIKNNKYEFYFKNILYGIRDQNYKYFKKILKSNSKCKIANLYLFVKCAADFCYNLTKDKNKVLGDKLKLYEDKMWNYYEQLDSDLKSYVLGKGKYHKNVINLAGDENYLPYINFKSIKEYLADYIVFNYENIKRNLKMGEVESSDVFNLILKKLKIYEPLCIMNESSHKLKNITDQKKIIPYTMDVFTEILNKLQESYKIINDNFLDFTFLFEKIDAISDEDYIENIKFETGILKNSNDCLAARNAYLHIPQNTNGITNKHFIDKYKLYCANREFKKIKDKFKNLVNDLNKYADIDADEIYLDESTDKIHKFLEEISENKLKSIIYYDEYENELNKLIVNYQDKLNAKTISDIEASRDLSRVAPEKMDLILMPIFRSIEDEIKTRIFNKFFIKFNGVKYDKIKNTLLEDKEESDNWKNTESKLKSKNTTLGCIVHYDKEFLCNGNKIYNQNKQKSAAFYLKKFIDEAGCTENYYEMIQLLKDYRYNELTFYEIRNAIAHREEKNINKFDENMLNDIMKLLVKTPEGVIFNMLEIEKAINCFLEKDEGVLLEDK